VSYLLTILKLLIPSIAISMVVKYIAPLYPISPTPIALGVAILSPPILLSIYLAIDGSKARA
jgi:hypothetical protein